MEIAVLTDIRNELTEIRELLQLNSSPWLSIKGACTYTGLGRSSIVNLIQSRKVQVYRPTPKRILLKKDDLDKFISKTRQTERGRKRIIDNALSALQPKKQETMA